MTIFLSDGSDDDGDGDNMDGNADDDDGLHASSFPFPSSALLSVDFFPNHAAAALGVFTILFPTLPRNDDEDAVVVAAAVADDEDDRGCGTVVVVVFVSGGGGDDDEIDDDDELLSISLLSVESSLASVDCGHAPSAVVVDDGDDSVADSAADDDDARAATASRYRVIIWSARHRPSPPDSRTASFSPARPRPFSASIRIECRAAPSASLYHRTLAVAAAYAAVPPPISHSSSTYDMNLAGSSTSSLTTYRSLSGRNGVGNAGRSPPAAPSKTRNGRDVAPAPSAEDAAAIIHRCALSSFLSTGDRRSKIRPASRKTVLSASGQALTSVVPLPPPPRPSSSISRRTRSPSTSVDAQRYTTEEAAPGTGTGRKFWMPARSIGVVVVVVPGRRCPTAAAVSLSASPARVGRPAALMGPPSTAATATLPPARCRRDGPILTLP